MAEGASNSQSSGVDNLDGARVRAVIAPHQGYSYSGKTAGYAYATIDASSVRRVFVLGPSHHLYLSGCALTGTHAYETPFGDIPIDAEMNATLRRAAPGAFETMDIGTDEDEHSIEMHLPFVARIMGNKPYKLVPILVGSLSVDSERAFGALLAPYLADDSNLFVVSSDFCHWGARFGFQYQDKSKGWAIHESIRRLDKMGMSLIEAQDADGFVAYLRKYKNTICGRHPISVLLRAIEASPSTYTTTFNNYAQSSQCRCVSDSSVSYASAFVVKQ